MKAGNEGFGVKYCKLLYTIVTIIWVVYYDDNRIKHFNYKIILLDFDLNQKLEKNKLRLPKRRCSTKELLQKAVTFFCCPNYNCNYNLDCNQVEH